MPALQTGQPLSDGSLGFYGLVPVLIATGAASAAVLPSDLSVNLTLHLEDGLNLDGRVFGKAGHGDGCAGVAAALTEDFDQ